ncbi:hypothetical protein RQP46_005465 [Phenoliferia psychrophenolica]
MMPNGSQAYDIAALSQPAYVDNAPAGIARPGSSQAFPGQNGSQQYQQGGGRPPGQQNGAPPSGDPSYASSQGGAGAGWPGGLPQQQQQRFQQGPQQGFAQSLPQQQLQQSYGQQPNATHPSSQAPSNALPRNQDWASIVSGLTPEKFNALPPNQQAALREFITRQKMQQQQAQLGHGYPSSPAGSGGGSPAAGGSPALPSGQSQQSAAFMKALSDFHVRKGLTFNGPALVEGRMLDMSRLYTLMVQSGGYVKVQANPGLWRGILSQMGFPPDVSGSHPEARINAAYHGTIFPFEQAFSQMQQQRSQAIQQQQLNLQNAARANGGIPPPHLPPGASVNSPYQNAPQQLPQGMAQQAQQRLEGEDRKGKGKAMDGASLNGQRSLDDLDLAPDGLPPSSSPYPSSILQNSTSNPNLRPGSGSIESPKPTSKPEAPTGPVRRKRQRIEYIPLQRPVDTYASWDLGQVEDVVVAASQRKRPRTVHDLGSLDVHSLTMSLKSRLGSEVACALNALTLISLTVRQSASDQQGLAFPLAACGELFDELLDLLEETAFGVADEPDDDKIAGEPVPPPAPLLSYRELFRIVTQEAMELAELPEVPKRRAATLADDGLCPLEPTETILALVNLLRNFSLSDENVKIFSARRKVLHVLVRIADLPLKRDGPRSGRWPVQVSAAQSLVLRKDVVETLSHFAIDVRLDAHSEGTAQALFRLLTFFILDADHVDQLYFDLSTSPSSSSRIPQAPYIPMSHYLALGLSAFARITTPDANRYVFAEHCPVDLFDLFESLVHLLPVTESDFQLVTTETGLFFAETLATALYNIAFLAPAALKLRLRVVPSFIRSFLRVVKRLFGTSADQTENPFVMLCEHCIAILTLLSEVGGISAVGGQQATGGLWFGLGSLADEDDRPSGLNPSEPDRGTVTAKQPPKSGRHKAPAVLSGDPRQIFNLLVSGMPAPFAKLSGLLDASMLGDHAHALVVESSRSNQTRSLLAYNTSSVRSVIRESHTLNDALAVAGKQYNNTPGAPPGVVAQMTINAVALRRNMRGLIVYHQQRLDILRDKYWENGGTLRAAFSESEAPETRKHLASADITFVQKYNDLCVEFKESWYGDPEDLVDPPVQLMQATQLLAGGTTMPPPRDVFVSVRVVGESQSLESKNGGGVLSLHKGSQYHVPFEDVEDLLVNGTLELIE